MTNKEAIKLLQQIYPNGGHCWLDEQRLEAINMAIEALKSTEVSDDLEEAAEMYVLDEKAKPWSELCKKAFKAGANWLRMQLLKESIEREVKIDAGGYPYISCEIELYDYDNDIPLAKKGDKVNLIIIKD